jgi:hypothetical protein
MKKTIQYYVQIVFTAVAVISVLAFSFGYRVRAGQNGLVNGLGVGFTSVNVNHSMVTNKITTPNNTSFPSAAMATAPTAGYQTNGLSPAGTATNTWARSKALDFGRWTNSLHVANSGDGVDNPELESQITIIPADCASLDFNSIINQSQSEIYSNGNSGTISVNANATAGTALWLRGFEYIGSMADVPLDDPNTVENESIEYLKAHGTAKFEILMVGPFSYGSNNCPLILPFTLSRGNLEDLVIASDTVAKSNPLLLNCPSNIVVSCGQPVVYGPVTYGACGQVDITFNPAAGSSLPVGVTPVTVTLADHDGNSTNCSFTVTVLDTSSPTVPTLPVLTGQCSVTVPTPTATNTCGITTKTATGTTSDPLLYTTQGTNTVHWSFNDGNGNVSTGNQTVIVKDTIPPVTPVLPAVTGSCSTPVTLTAPTATDNCAGTVTGTTTTVFPITAQGTTAVVWRFNDGNGNTSTATQNVVMAGLTFKGFYSPVGTVSNLCTAPVQANQGSVLPLKFDMLCGTTTITAGTAPIVKIQLWTGCQFVSEPVSVAAVYNNDWHYNWDTSAWAKGIYKVIVILPDGTSRYVFVKLK